MLIDEFMSEVRFQGCGRWRRHGLRRETEGGASHPVPDDGLPRGSHRRHGHGQHIDVQPLVGRVEYWSGLGLDRTHAHGTLSGHIPRVAGPGEPTEDCGPATLCLRPSLGEPRGARAHCALSRLHVSDLPRDPPVSRCFLLMRTGRPRQPFMTRRWLCRQ